MSSLIPSQVVRGNHLRTPANTTQCSPDDSSDQRTDILTPSSEYKGDPIEEKQNNHFRIGVINIHGIPKHHNHPKNINIKETINNYNFDFIGITETNYYWPLVSPDNKWHERIRTWWNRSKTELAYYKHPITPTLHQPGGVISVALHQTTSATIESGHDAVLGRWSWITL